MNGAILAQTVLILFVPALFEGLFVWRIWSGQFRDVEVVRCAVVDEDERVDEP